MAISLEIVILCYFNHYKLFVESIIIKNLIYVLKVQNHVLVFYLTTD